MKEIASFILYLFLSAFGVELVLIVLLTIIQTITEFFDREK